MGYGVWRSGIGIVYRGQKEITYKNNTVQYTAHTAPIKDINNTHPTGINSTNLYYVLSVDLFATSADLSYRSIMQDDKPPI